MSIHFIEQEQLFHLQAGDVSYALQVLPSGDVVHLYWGQKVRTSRLAKLLRIEERAFSPNPEDLSIDRSYSLDTLPLEYPTYGHGDYRQPALHVQQENGSTILDLKYESHRIISGKPNLVGLPATYVEADEEADTLEIHLRDSLTNLLVILRYTAFASLNVITKSTQIINEGNQVLSVQRVFSASIDLPDSDYEMLQLSGAWARERHMVKRPLVAGLQGIDSRRGSSSHMHNPFLALLRQGSTEDTGDVYGVNLVYSGSFTAHADVDPYGGTRVQIGIQPFDFSWLLEPGQSLQSPEAVLVFSHEGLGGLSRTYHKLYRDRERPVLVNNWEATYFDFNAEKIVAIADRASTLGIELFVLDDGWFGKRDDDFTSLGDWKVYADKLPGGLDELARQVNDRGVQFGLWFEPEMVSPDSDLYRAHPDWCLHVPDRKRSLSRSQLVLDLSREDVCEYVIGAVSDILEHTPITYVKWDMNRNMTEIGSVLLPHERQRETAHRYMLGLYHVLETITSRFPHVLFESCSGGGGRFDPGMLYYMPQTWTSDDTDAIERLYIQYGTSIVYPVSTMGAHVSAVPNHQVHRITSLKMRGDVAMSGNFGYELDLTKFTADDDTEVKRQVQAYKSVRQLIQFGEMYRLRNPFEGNDASWMFVSEDGTEAIALLFQILAKPNAPFDRLRLRGLDPEADYEAVDTGIVYGGDELMRIGINVPEMIGDFQSYVVAFKKVL